jgi:hypothetical protein
VVDEAWQIMKKSATASGILRKSRLTICSPFLSFIDAIIALKNFELRVMRVTLFGRVSKTDNCDNNK